MHTARGKLKDGTSRFLTIHESQEKLLYEQWQCLEYY